MQTFDTQKSSSVLYLKIEPNSVCHAMLEISSLAKILNALNTSFENFILVEIAKRFSNPKSALKKEIKQLLSETKLLIADYDSSQLQLEITVNLASKYQYRVLNKPSALKEELFNLFIDTIFKADLFDAERVAQIIKKYNPKERVSIFQSVDIDLINQNNFNLYFGKSKAKVNQTWLKTEDKEITSSLLPEPVKKVKGEVETYYQYVKTGEESDLFGKRSKYKKVLIKETVAPDLYPYQLQKIKVNGKEVSFSRQLTAAVTVNHNQYQISLPELQIKVQNESRTDAENAFDADLKELISRYEKGSWAKSDLKATAVFAKLKELIIAM